MRFQTAFAVSQRDYPQAGDIDDCWCVADLAAMHTVAPWLYWPGITAYREAASVPDRPHKPDGGQLVDSVTALRKLWPEYAVRRIIGGTWAELTTAWHDGRPTSVSVLSSELPARLRFGFDGFHRVTILRKPDGQLVFMNPLQQPMDRWIDVREDDVKPAILAYGKAKRGVRSAYAVTFPTLSEAMDVYAPEAPQPPVTPPGADELAQAYNDGLSAAEDAVRAVPRR